ncbi:hypothetical protein AGMMS49940_03960 [Spirochaetia bacterium]|nr:hypothetical protein AGMMS49940_03960 [Spirochaetia bacterium]
MICIFRTENKAAFEEAFVKVLVIAREMGHLKKVGGISVDGTKIKRTFGPTNASKHKAVSYKHAKKMIGVLEEEVRILVAKAEEADSKPLEEGLTIPEEIKRRQERIAKLEAAKVAMEERYEVIKQHEQAAYEEKVLEREKREHKTGKKPGGKAPKPPSDTPPDTSQFNFTDSDSRIMKAGNGNHFEQAYNGEAAVDTEGSMLLLGGQVTNHANDKEELSATVDSVPKEVREISATWLPRDVSADTGFFSAKEIEAVEKKTIDEEGKETQEGPIVYCAVKKQSHHRTVEDLEQKPDIPPPLQGAPIKEQMAHRLQTPEGKATYKKRKETVEPVFGIIKSVIGFRQFLVRGLEKVNTEWSIVKLAYNFKRLHRLSCASVPN